MGDLKYRHGDVDLFDSELPKNAVKKPGTTVALGEATGHHHTLYPTDEKTKIELFEHVENLVKKTYVQITGGAAELRHQEHKTIKVEPGVYKIKIERTHNPFTKQINQVID